MTKAQKILLVVGVLSVAVGGFFLTKYLTRNVRKIRGGTVTLQTYEAPPSEQPLADDDSTEAEPVTDDNSLETKPLD